MHNIDGWQRLIEHLANNGSGIGMSDIYYAKTCNTDIRTVQAFKDQYRSELEWYTYCLTYFKNMSGENRARCSILNEINRLRNIPRCPLCNKPLSESETCELTLPGNNFDRAETVHRACMENQDESIRWKANMLRNWQKKHHIA